MKNLATLISKAKKQGYKGVNAEAKICQDIILCAIANSKLHKNITVKGGLVMRNITKDYRRATVDIDLDFIKYSLNDDSIKKFVKSLNTDDDIKIEIIKDIEELSQQEYKGKRVYIQLSDVDGNQIRSKIDFGVHVNMDMKQEQMCFDVCLNDEGISLLVNSKEQIFVEKLKSLLRFGPISTRYKDVFDLYYLSDLVDKRILVNYIDKHILKDKDIRESSMNDICNRIDNTFNNRMYRSNFIRSRTNNWLQLDAKQVMEGLIVYLKELNKCV